MHRVLFLGDDQDLKARVEALLADAGSVGELVTLDHFPGEIELARLLQTQRPHVILLVVNSMLAVSDFMHRMSAASPSTPVLALSQYTDQRTVGELMHAGVRGLIPIPLIRSQFLETFRDSVGGNSRLQQFREEVIPQLSSFLPGKGGSGTSRLACHFSLSLAAEAERRQGAGRVLLLDLDMSSGLVRYLFERTNAYSLVDMIEAGVALDGVYWHQVVSRYGNLDVVLSGRPNPRHPLSPARIKQVLDAAAQQYGTICADLSGNQESYSLEVLRRSALIFLVTSTEPGAIQLARERFEFLDRLGLSRRVRLLLNRFAGSASASTQRIASDIGTQVAAEYDYDDRRVIDSMNAMKPFDQRIPISRHIAQTASKLIWESPRVA